MISCAPDSSSPNGRANAHGDKRADPEMGSTHTQIPGYRQDPMVLWLWGMFTAIGLPALASAFHALLLCSVGEHQGAPKKIPPRERNQRTTNASQRVAKHSNKPPEGSHRSSDSQNSSFLKRLLSDGDLFRNIVVVSVTKMRTTKNKSN